jgi:RNA 2',3'-cyclic 3'-phosphodiesterase
MLRLFIAVPLPEDIQDALGAISTGIPGAAWTPNDNMHITLRFIGEVDAAAAHDIDDMLLGVRPPAFDLTIEGVGHFGPLREARLLWAGVPRIAPLVHLRDKVESAVVRAGQPPETRKFVPHVTLARIKGETGHHLANFLAENSLLRLGPFPVTHFTLFRSHLKRSGSVYEPLADYPLEGAPVELAAAGAD